MMPDPPRPSGRYAALPELRHVQVVGSHRARRAAAARHVGGDRRTTRIAARPRALVPDAIFEYYEGGRTDAVFACVIPRAQPRSRDRAATTPLVGALACPRPFFDDSRI